MFKRYFQLAVFLLGVMLPAHAVTISVTYTDSAGEGFFDSSLGAQRRTAFEAAASQWAQTLSGSQAIKISASFDDLGGENQQGLATLGFAGPAFLFKDFSGAPQSSTYYAVALANQFAGGDIDPSNPDITAQFNSRVDGPDVFGNIGFYYGTDLNAGSDFDFYSIALHEIGHGLGFLDGMQSNGTFVFGQPSVWDRHMATGSASSAALFPDLTSTQRATALVSNNLFFSGVNTRAANGNLNAKLYAPNPYESGSSTAHLDETVFSPPPDGTASNSIEELMTPLATENTHTIGPVVLGIMRDLGWSLLSTPSEIRINDVTVNEGDTGQSNAVLTVTLSQASSKTVTVNYATANNTALAGSDYVATSGTLSFAPGETSKTISIPIYGDQRVEGDETFFVNLSGESNGNLVDAQGIVLITESDVNVAPVNGSLSPTSATNAPGVIRLFTATYTDVNGANDFSYVMLHINSTVGAQFALRVQYNPVNNKLYLLNDDKTAWLGGFTLGSNNVISNGQGSIDCAQTTVTKGGNNIKMTWAVKASGTWAGTTVKTFMLSKDKAGLQDGYDERGTWTISGNSAPVSTSLTPDAVSVLPNQEVSLTSTYSDANGQGNIAQVLLRVGSTTASGFRVFYNPLNNKLFLLNDAGTAYLGGKTPGVAGTISNSRGTLNCGATTVSRSANTITVNWRISLKTTDWVGTAQAISLSCKDRGGAVDAFRKFGTWNLVTPPIIGRTTTTSISSADAVAGTDEVLLNFATPLDAQAASDPTNYSVQINGADAAVEEAEAVGSKVSLYLSQKLRAGDKVAVAWRNLPGSGGTTIIAK